MAELNNNNAINASRDKVYATDEAGMMTDAKDYARRDMSTIIKVLEKLDVDTEKQMQLIVSSVVAVKYEQIDKSRNERPAWDEFL